jgi:hypothetical protein
MTGWQAQTVVWDPSQPVSNVSSGGVPRGGLDLTNVTGPTAMTLAELNNEYVNLGFVGNMAPRSCEFSEFKIYLAR